MRRVVGGGSSLLSMCFVFWGYVLWVVSLGFFLDFVFWGEFGLVVGLVDVVLMFFFMWCCVFFEFWE